MVTHETRGENQSDSPLGGNAPRAYELPEKPFQLNECVEGLVSTHLREHQGSLMFERAGGQAEARPGSLSCPFVAHYTLISEKAMAAHSSVLAWRIPGTGEPGGLRSMGSQRAGHD